MKVLFVLSVILATCLAKAVTSDGIVNAAAGYAYAVDLAVPVSFSAFSCMKQYGYKTVFIRAYDPTGAGRFDTNSVNNIRSANQAGLGTEVYMTPQPHSNKRGSEQFRELYEGLRSGKIQVRTVWVQVTSPVNWGANSQANIYFLNELLSMAKYYGVTIGLYTNVYDWNQITKGATVEGVMLWYWNVNGGGVNGETPANFDDFRPFAKFTKPTVKQFGQVEYLCGVTVNRDVYLVNNAKHFLASAAENTNEELIVGTLGGDQMPGLVQSV
ncbi:hypothetical protein ANCCEY_09468 [Ancylostoma ceylanicum]|uniref:Lysozyme n=2 Tax=Ancylostoma ceylanicum TaxID=53326 RepID=A0A016TZR9_9BILA|nr:hypothetical protein ANCCEY_09468 [Ancylostoma ceylanicum]EYC08340.1 hypothetical protein Y032_0066g3707 [Ancylostoma ceylanicum]